MRSRGGERGALLALTINSRSTPYILSPYADRSKRRTTRAVWLIPLACVIVISKTLRSNLETPVTTTTTTGEVSNPLFTDDNNIVNASQSITTNVDVPMANMVSSRPVLILHVGPPKTGSTTLQCTLESLRRELDMDGIAYIGRPECLGMDIDPKFKQDFKMFSMALVDGFDCQKQLIEMEGKQQMEDNRATLEERALPSCWDGFIQRLKEYRESSTNVIFSDEAMSNRVARTWQYRPNLPYPWSTLKSTLEGMGWDVRILIVHRPLHDYLPSVYIEQYKEGRNKHRLRKWFGGGSGDKCPSQGGRVVPRPFDTSTREITIANLLKHNQALYPTPAQVYELFRDHGFTTILVDMMEQFTSTHGKELNFIQHIICDKLPGTIHTCTAQLNRDDDANNKEEDTMQKPQRLNPSLSLHYDFIAVEACQNGLFNGTVVSRDVARRAIQRRQELDLGLSPNDFPLVCPNNFTLREIFNHSLDHERRLRILNHWGPDEESHHEERFWKAVRDKKKFCTVDSKRLVEDEKWIEFFSTAIDRE